MYRHSLRWLWNISDGIRRSVAISAGIRLLLVGESLFFVYVCKILVDIATGVSSLAGSLYTILLIACVGLRLLLAGLNVRLLSQSEVRLKNGLRRRLLVRLMGVTPDGRFRRHSGDVLNRLGEDVRVVANLLGRVVPSLVSIVVQFIAAFLFLSHLEPLLAVSVVVIMPVCLLIARLFAVRIRRLTSEIRQRDGEVQSHIQESLQHLVLVQTLERESWVEQRLYGIQQGLYRLVMERSRLSVYSRAMVNSAFSVGYAVAFLWGVEGIQKGTITFGMMTAFLQLVGQIQRPLVEMGQQLPGILHAMTSVDRLIELEDDSEETDIERVTLPGGLGIRLEQVTYAYPDGRRVILDHFSHDFSPGSRTAIVGETGAGKTTLFRLMLALLQPENGRICLYNNKEEVEVSPAVRNNLVYVPQGNSLWSGTIRENLLLGNPEATEEEMARMLEMAAADFVFDFPEGLDTPCSELGGGLSEGQAQRIAIARALLRPGAVLLFDEFTSSLDDETERLLMQNLTRGLPERTMLFITHRQCILDYCDTVVRIDRITKLI